MNTVSIQKFADGLPKEAGVEPTADIQNTQVLFTCDPQVLSISTVDIIQSEQHCKSASLSSPDNSLRKSQLSRGDAWDELGEPTEFQTDFQQSHEYHWQDSGIDTAGCINPRSGNFSFSACSPTYCQPPSIEHTRHGSHIPNNSSISVFQDPASSILSACQDLSVSDKCCDKVTSRTREPKLHEKNSCRKRSGSDCQQPTKSTYLTPESSPEPDLPTSHLQSDDLADNVSLEITFDLSSNTGSDDPIQASSSFYPTIDCVLGQAAPTLGDSIFPPKKRTRQNLSFEEGYEINGQQHVSDVKDNVEATKTVILACPFYKKDATKYHHCLKFNLHRIKDVKQHVYRKHMNDLYCARCFRTFQTRELRDKHTREAECDKKYQIDAQLEGISEPQRKKLQQYVSRGRSMPEKWFEIWDVVFPGQQRPKSCYLGNYPEEIVRQLEVFWNENQDDIIRQVSKNTRSFSIDRSLLSIVINTLFARFTGEVSEAAGGRTTSGLLVDQPTSTRLEVDQECSLPSPLDEENDAGWADSPSFALSGTYWTHGMLFDQCSIPLPSDFSNREGLRKDMYHFNAS